MRIIYKDSKETIEKEYPCKDISIPVPGLNMVKIDGKMQPCKDVDRIQLYYIEIENIENPNPDKYNIVPKPDELTNEVHSDYKHLKICKRGFELVEKPQQEIIDRINSEYGQFVDNEYPQVVRLNHIIELNQGTSSERKGCIESMQNWLLDCKAQKEQKIKEYVENNGFPTSFNDYSLIK